MLYAFNASNWTPALEEQHTRVDGLAGLRPSDVLVYDFRAPNNSAMSAPSSAANSPLKVVQWNIERGYKLEGIIAELLALDADVVIMQELDISCQRSDFKNTPLLIAKALGAMCAFVCEFHELPSTCTCRRNADSESGCDYGFHGNAILTKTHLLHSIRALEHSCGLDWAVCGFDRKEPRVGTRYILTGCIDVSDGLPVTENSFSPATHQGLADGQTSNNSSMASNSNSAAKGCHFTRVQLYTLHLEIFCGPLMRLRQLSDALADAKARRRQFYCEMNASASTTPSPNNSIAIQRPFYGDGAASGGGGDVPLAAFGVPMGSLSSPYAATPMCPPRVPIGRRHYSIVIGGDLNTIMHGIVRLSGLYSDDRTRWMSLGETEAEWLQRKVFALPKRRGASLPSGLLASPPSTREERNAALDGRGQSWAQWFRSLYWRHCYGVHVEHSARLCNDELKLFDVFDKLRDITLDNPAYKGFVTGKLDWLLLSNVKVTSKAIGNHDYSLSDHKYLVNTLVLPPFAKKGSGEAEVVGLLSPNSTAARDKAFPQQASAAAAASPSGGFLDKSVGNGSFFWADESLAAAYDSHRDSRSMATTLVRWCYVGLATAVMVYAPYRLLAGRHAAAGGHQ